MVNGSSRSPRVIPRPTPTSSALPRPCSARCCAARIRWTAGPPRRCSAWSMMSSWMSIQLWKCSSAAAAGRAGVGLRPVARW